MKTLLITLCLITQWCLHICEAFHLLIGLPSDTENFYLRMKEASNGGDPFDNYDWATRKSVCDQMLQANVYYLDTKHNFPTGFHSTSIIREITAYNYQELGHGIGIPENILNYREGTVEIRSTSMSIKMFPCARYRGTTHYLTYGFGPNYIFVLSKPETSRKFRITGLLESSATLSQTMIQSRDNMVNHFWNYIANGIDLSSSNLEGSIARDVDLNVHPEEESLNDSTTVLTTLPVRTNMQLNSLSQYQHFRLCVAVANEITRYNLLQLNIDKINLVRSMEAIQDYRKGIIKDDRRHVTYAQVLPCAINHEWTDPQFYLLRDPTSPASLFVLRPMHIETYDNILWLEAIVDNVRALHEP